MSGASLRRIPEERIFKDEESVEDYSVYSEEAAENSRRSSELLATALIVSRINGNMK